MKDWAQRDILGTIHVVPVDDIKDHYPTIKCWCNPIYDDIEEILCHNSLDRREFYERSYRIYGPN